MTAIDVPVTRRFDQGPVPDVQIRLRVVPTDHRPDGGAALPVPVPRAA